MTAPASSRRRFLEIVVLGAAAVPVAASLELLEIPVMMGFALVLYPLMRRDMKIARGEGAFLLGCYAALLAYQLHLANAAA